MRFKKSTIVTVLMLAFALVTVFFSSNTAFAETKKPYLNSTTGTVFLYTEDTLTVQDIPGGLQSITWDSSNESVLTVKSNSKTGVVGRLIPKKTGTSTVTCTVKTLTKTYSLTCNIKVKKASPFNKIYINGKNKYKSKTSTITYNTESSSMKVTARVKSGWSIVGREYQVFNTATSANDIKDIASNGKVPVGKYLTKVYFTARNSDNEYFVYTVILKKVTSGTANPSFSKKTDTIFLSTKNNEVAIKNFPNGASAVWSSSNKSIATVKKSSSNEGIGLLTPKKKGKTTISCIVTKKDGTTKTISYTLYVKSKVKPLEALEIDGDNIIGDTKSNYYKFSTTDHSVLVQSYENSGWTIISETYTVYKTPKSYENEQKIVGIGTVPVGTYKSLVTVKLKNSSGAIYTFTLDLFNSNYQK